MKKLLTLSLIALVAMQTQIDVMNTDAVLRIMAGKPNVAAPAPSANNQTYFTPKNIGIIAACSAVIGSGIYYLIKWNKIRNTERTLCNAAQSGDLGNVIVSLAQGANINTFQWDPLAGPGTPLMFATKYKHKSVIEYLLKNGAQTCFDPKSIQSDVIRFALETKNYDIISLFIKHNKETQERMLSFAQSGYLIESDKEVVLPMVQSAILAGSLSKKS